MTIQSKIKTGNLVRLKTSIPFWTSGQRAYMLPVVQLHPIVDNCIVMQTDTKYTWNSQPMMYLGTEFLNADDDSAWHSFLHEGKLYALWVPITFNEVRSDSLVKVQTLDEIFDVAI